MKELTIFSNTSAEEDSVFNALIELSAGNQVRIASAFFEDWRTLKTIAESAKSIELIVRLNEGTSSVALDEVIDLENVKVFYYTAHSFHPKLYVFGNKAAIVGSSNFTHSGLHTNAEMNILIPAANKLFPRLAQKFEGYKAAANNLTRDILRQYQEIEKSHKGNGGRSMDSAIQQQPWAKAPVNSNTQGTKPSEWNKHQAFIQKYEAFLGNFQILKTECEKNLYIMKLGEKIPLRVVIDQFLNWIKETKISGRSYLKVPVRDIPGLQQSVSTALKEFAKDAPDIDYAAKNYKTLSSALGSVESINGLTQKHLGAAVSRIYAFSTYIGRYHSEEGPEGFLDRNREEDIKKTLAYLLHGSDDFKTRIARATSDEEYRLHWFGDSSVTELYGWINSDGTPILNGRVKKAMRQLGFDIEILPGEDWE